MGIARYLARKLGELVALMLLASLLVYGALYVAPGDPLSTLAKGRVLSPATVAQLRAQYHLNDGFVAGWLHWVWNALHLDFGMSVVYRSDVASLLTARLGVTLWLAVMAGILIVLGGIGLGALSAVRRGVPDQIVLMSTTVGLALPSFVAAVLLVTVFGVELGWLPTFGSGTGFADRFKHMILPSIALALASTAYVARITRSAMITEAAGDHVLAARSRGLSELTVTRKHILRNAMIPVSTAAGLTAAGLIGGTTIIETAFQLPGIGSLLVQSIQSHDVPVVQAVTIVLVFAFVVINAVVDALYVVIDPRLRRRASRA